MPNPTTKLVSFLFKERRPSQTSLELSSSRGVFGKRESERKKKERRERGEKIKAKLKNKTLFTKAVNETYKNSPKACKTKTIYLYYYKTRGALYRQPQGMKIPKNLKTKLSYWTKE